MLRILLIGSMPPPIGGITIHLDRFFNLYKNTFNIGILDIKKKTLFKKDKRIKAFFPIFNFFLRSNIVHIHITNDYFKVIFALLSRICFKTVIYTHHNSIVKNKLVFKVMYKLCHKIILVNDKSINKNLINYKKTEVIPAFLPPYKFENLPTNIENELTNYKNVISTNCYLYNLINEKHVYGFDLIIDAFYHLSRTKRINNTLLILVDPSGTTKDYVDSLLKELDFKTNKILHITENIDFVSLVKKSSLTIRATRTDGDSLSVRESLYFKVPIIASDVTWRPNGTILFKNNDSKDLAKKIIYTLNNKYEIKYYNENYGNKIINLYHKFLKH